MNLKLKAKLFVGIMLLSLVSGFISFMPDVSAKEAVETYEDAENSVFGFNTWLVNAQLVNAVNTGDAEGVRELLLVGADPNAVDQFNMRVLDRAARDGNAEIVRLLLNYGAEVNTTGDLGGFTALYEAAGHGHAEVVQLLLNAGANPQATTREGETALTKARYEREHRAREIRDFESVLRRAGDNAGFNDEVTQHLDDVRADEARLDAVINLLS